MEPIRKKNAEKETIHSEMRGEKMCLLFEGRMNICEYAQRQTKEGDDYEGNGNKREGRSVFGQHEESDRQQEIEMLLHSKRPGVIPQG